MRLKRNTADFKLAPTQGVERSQFKTLFNKKDTFNNGKLVPVHAKEVLPGDHIKMDVAAAIRTSTPIAPVMDNLYFNLRTFFVANRNLMDGWEELQGENTAGKWKVGSKGTKGVVPMITPPVKGWNVGSVAEKFGLPIGVRHHDVSHLPIRAYTYIWNEFFRDQNNQVQAYQNLKDNSLSGGTRAGEGSATATAYYGGEMLSVAKKYDYFTYALPEPQKADDVLIPVGSLAPVITTADRQGDASFDGLLWASDVDGSSYEYFGASNKVVGNLGIQGKKTEAGGSGIVPPSNIHPDNLYADLSKATGISVNDLRELIAAQHIFEGDALNGTRYFERLETIWGVNNVMARLDRPELIGTHTGMLNMTQVLQTSSTDATTPQGNTAAYSLTALGHSNMVDYAVREHGFIITLAFVRADHTYSYGIHKMWNKTERFDFFEPDLAHLGQDAILSQEIYADGSKDDKSIFGYRPKWDEYRHEVSQVGGLFRPAAPQALKQWTYADEFSTRPILGDDFIQETADFVDRTLAVQSSNQDQFIMDLNIYYDADRPIPLNSTPGLERI